MLFKDCQNFSYLGVDVAVRVQLSILLNNCRCFSLWCSSLTIAIFPHQINALPWQLLKMGGKRLVMKRKWEMFCPNEWYTSDAKEKLIPNICHFFTRLKFLESKIYTEKRHFFRVKSVKNANFSRKICRKCQFFSLNL